MTLVLASCAHTCIWSDCRSWDSGALGVARRSDPNRTRKRLVTQIYKVNHLYFNWTNVAFKPSHKIETHVRVLRRTFARTWGGGGVPVLGDGWSSRVWQCRDPRENPGTTNNCLHKMIFRFKGMTKVFTWTHLFLSLSRVSYLDGGGELLRSDSDSEGTGKWKTCLTCFIWNRFVL